MKRISAILGWCFLYILGVAYLTLPSPAISDLPEALKSDEPGDTWQNPNTKAFFTDWDRETVIKHYKDSFRLELFGYPLPNLRLNYRPEDTGTYVRKHIDSYYLEEIVIPFRESVFINGWNPKKSPSLSHLSDEERKKIMIVVNGHEFEQKITLRWYQSDMWRRVAIWTATFVLTSLVFLYFGKAVLELSTSLWAFFTSKK